MLDASSAQPNLETLGAETTTETSRTVASNICESRQPLPNSQLVSTVLNNREIKAANETPYCILRILALQNLQILAQGRSCF